MINKSNISDTEAPLLNLNVSISKDILTNKISDKRDDSDFDIVICFHSDGVYISQLIRFAKKGKRKVQGVPQLQTAALPRPQEEEKIDKSKQAQTEQTYEKH